MIKKLVTGLIICITLLSISCTKVKAENISRDLGARYMWTTDRVNLRVEPSLTAEVITTIDKRCKVIVIFTTDKWIKVKHNNDVGYVYSEYLTDKERFTSGNNRWGIELTDDEIDLLAKIVWTESRSESDDGEAAVVNVVFNRMYSMNYPDTLYEVLSETNAFSSWKLRDKAQPTEREYEIINEVVCGEYDIISMDVMYFSTEPRNDNIEVKIGDHYFCTEE
jgi:hypothetical protein